MRALRLKKKSLRGSLFVALTTALLLSLTLGFFSNSANAVLVSSTTSECQVDVGNTTGVTLTLSGGKCFLTFTSPGTNTWTAPAAVRSFNVIVVAGGGGGGPDGGSGGGSGSLYEGTVSLGSAVSPTFNVSVGAGGNRGMHTAPSGQTYTNASAGGNSVFSSSGLSFSISAFGGGPGDWPDWSNQKAGGSAGATPTVASGSLTVAPTTSTAGRAGANAPRADTVQSGLNGNAGVTSTLFGGQFIGSGGSGAIIGNGSTPGGSASDGGGRGGGGNNHTATSFSMPGTNGTGGGGGGGSRNAPVGEIFLDGRSDHSRNGSAGGSGIIGISYTAPKLTTATASSVGALLNVPFFDQPRIQLKNSENVNASISGVVVTATPSSGTLFNNTATTNASGRADFSGLQFTSGSLGSVTITFSAPGYASVYQVVTIQTLATDVTISSAANSNGRFVGGVWLANSAATSNINASALATEIASRPVTIEASAPTSSAAGSAGNIRVQSSVSQQLWSDRTLTLKATRTIAFDAGVGISVTDKKLNVVLWSDSDGTNSGSVTMAGGNGVWALSTNGGHVAIGGGTTSTSWHNLTIPSGYAAGEGDVSSAWWGVEFGVNQATSNRKIINTGGGNLRVYGEAKQHSSATVLYGVLWEGGEISTGAGTVEINGKTTGSPSTASNQNFGVGIGANFGSADDAPLLNTTAAVSITGTTSVDTTDHMGVYFRGTTINAGSGVVTVSTDKRIKFDQGNTISSRLNATSTSHIYVPGSNSFTGSSGGKALTLTSNSGWVEVTGALTTSADLDISCPVGGFSNSGSGAISVTGALSVQCDEISVSSALSSSGTTSLVSLGAAKNVTVNSNITTTGAGSDLLLKSKSSVVVDTAGVTLQTAGASSGTGGRIVLWSDSDASGQGYISIDPNSTLNTIGGATTTYSGGGDIHLAGGLDNGSTAISPAAVSGDGLPDGWAISDASGAMGIWYGYGAVSGNINTIQSGGGDIRMFGKSTSTSDAFALNWTTRMDSGEGQIELRADSGGWGLQLNRGGDADTYSPKSVFTSRSNTHPAIIIHGKSSGGTAYVGLLGSWADTGTDNLLIQAVGDGGVTLSADAPTAYPALGLTSTAVLSKSGKITIDGGTSTTTGNGAIHFGMLRSGHSQGSVQIGDCAVSTCSNSLVTSSTANVEIVGNRVSSLSSISTTVSSSGSLAILPAVGSSEFTDFQTKTAGLTLAQKLGGFQIGRPGDATGVVQPTMELQNDWKIAGPITVNAGRIYARSNLETTNSGSAPIRLISENQIYLNPSKTVKTNGSDVVFWSGSEKVAGSNKVNSTIYLDDGATISTAGGRIWLAGGLDDGGADASITSNRGKWSSVIAGDGLPDGYATGENSANEWSTGVLLDSNVKLLSGNGDIFVAGAHGPSGQAGYGHIIAYPGVQIDSGNGRVALWGRSLGSTDSQGIALNFGQNVSSVIVTSNAPTSDAITIYSDSSAGAGYSRGIVAFWHGSYSASRAWQGTQILATASGGGITMTGIGSAANVNDANGLMLDFIDILAVDGPIVLNGDSSALSNGSVGASFGWNNNTVNTVRLGGWTAGATGAVGGAVITTPGGVTRDFSTSSSSITINTDSFWTRESGLGMYGVYFGSTGEIKILPSNLASGLVAASDSFKHTQNTTDWSFAKLVFQLTPETFTLGRPATSTATKIGSSLSAHGAIKVYGSALNFVEGATSVSGRGALLFKSTTRITLAASKTYQTNGTDLVLWSGTAGGDGYIEVGNSVCINTNASCDLAVATATGNIHIGGGAAGTDFPTGPAVGTSSNGVSFGTTTSGIKILSGGGNISVKGQGSIHGVSSFQGITFKATTGAIDLQGSTTVTGNQALRFGAATGDTLITSAKTSGTAIRLRGTYSTHSAQWGVVFTDDDSTITATGGGDILIEAADATSGLNSKVFLSRVSATTSNGGRIQVKATGRNEIHNSSILTAGPVSGVGGEISIWADSDNDDTGSIYVSEPACISTIGTCSAPANTGGSKIVIGGGVADSSDSFFPAGGAVARTGDTFGVRFGSTHATNGVKIFSGGGDLRIASEQTSSTTTSDVYGQLWYGGTQLHSGTGMVDIVNSSGIAATGTSSYGLYISAIAAAPTSVVSAKSSGDAIKFLSTTNSTGNLSTPVLAFSTSTTDRVTFNASAGGNIVMTGNAQGTGADTYSFDLNNVDLLSTSGNITLSGNRGFWLNRHNAGSNNFGATSTTSSSGNIELLGNRYNQNSTHANNFKTTGSVTIAPLDAAAYLEATEFPKSGNTFTGVTALTFGNDTNTQSHTVGVALTGVTGPITFKTGAYTGTGSITTTSGPVSILSQSTVALNADVSAGAPGILVRSSGRITTSAGASVAAPRSITTNSGPITLWTTGAAGGVTLNNYVHLNSNSSGAGGADITIGGGSADVNDASIPGGNAASSANSGIILGTSNVDQIVRISAGTGDIVIRGESTTSSASRSGIDMMAGVKIIGGTVDLFGKANNPSTTNNTASGIFHYQDSATAKTLIEATKSFVSDATAVSVRGETSSGNFGMMLSNIGDAATVEDAVTIRTTGNNADINITGSTGLASGYSVQAAGLRLSTATGDVLVDSGDDALGWSRATGTRKVSYVPVTGQTGGNVTLRTPDVALFSSGSFDVTTTGVLTLEPPAGQSFSRAQTFPLTSSVIDVGGLVVGSADNTANLTQGAGITSSGDVRYLGGAQTGNFAITTSGSADIAFYPTTTFAKSTPVWSAGGDILIGTADARAATVSLSTSTLTAGGDLRIYSNQNVTQSAAISAGGAVVIDTSGSTGRIDIDKDIAAGVGGILLKANQDILIDTTAKNITTSGGGDIVLWASASGTGGDVDTGGLSVVIDSNGGDIVIAGGADDGANGGTASDGIPDNSIVGRTANHSARLMALMDSDAGRIVIRAQHSAHSVSTALGAIYLAPSARIRSTTGDISIIGTQNSGNTSTNNQYGVWLGQSTATASRATVSSTSGDIFISGDSSQSDRSNRRGVVLYGVNISTGGDVEIFGKAPSQTGAADILTWAPSSIAADGATLIEGAGISYLESTSIASGTGLTFEVGQLVGTAGLSNASFTRTALSITGSGPVTIRPDGASFTDTQSLNAINFDSTVSSLTVGKAGNTAGVTVAGVAKTIAGDITTISGSLTTSTALTSSSGNVAVTADSIDLGADLVASSGITTLATQTSNRTITAGTEVANTLSLTSTELGRITTGTLRLNTDGNVNFTASTNFTGKVTNLAIRAGGNVTGSAGVVITVANLGIDAGGTINFPGNQVASTIALQGSTITYNQTADYAVAAVDGIDPEFGYGVRFAIANVPVSGTLDAFMAVTFNPPPTVTIRDKFGNTLAANNTSAADYVVSTAFTLATTTSGTPVASGTTPTRSVGTFTFSDLKVVDGTGTGTFTFSATRNGTALTENSQFVDGASFVTQGAATFTTATYNIQAGEPASIALSFAATSAQAGKTGLAPTATLKDVGGNTIVSGPHANATISISIAGTDGTIVSGATASTVNGVASFPNLVLGGKVNTNYTLTFSVTFQDTQSQSVTVTEDEVVTLTFGDASKVTLGAATQTVANRTNLADIVATIRDAYDNVVTNSTAAVALSFGAGATLAESAVVTGYSAQNAVSGVATFSGISLAAKVDDYTVTASSGSLATASQVVTVTHGEAHSITLTAPATGTNDVVFGTQPVVRILDRDGNLVTTGPQATQTVSLSATGAVLDGTASMAAVAGEADFTGKDLKLTGLIGPKPLKASISSPGTIEETATITLQFGAATQLALTQAAAGFVNRTDFTTQPIVEVRDVSGNAVTNYSGTVAIGVGSGVTFSGTPSLVLNGTQSGLASFTGLGLYGTVGNYTLTYSSGSLTTATQSINLTHGVATQLSVTSEADGARAGIVFDDQPVVKVLDQDSNLVLTGDAATSNIRVQSSGATLSGTLTALAEAGVAAFSDLKLSGTVGTYQLSYSALSPALAAGFTTQTHDIELAPGVATEIHVTEQPSAVIAGEALDPVVSVQLRDDWQNVVTTDSSSTVKPVLVDATTEAVIDSSVAATAVTNGAVSFTGLSFTSAGERKLKFESGAITEVSDSFTITHAAASQIVWTSTEPSSMRNEIAISPAPTFEIRDQFGNPALTGPRFTVTASVVGGNSANVLALAGETITQASASAAITFPALSVKAPEDDYQLRFTAVNGATSFSVDSAAIPLTFGVPTQLSVTTPAATAGAGLAFGTQPVIHILDSAGNLVANSTLTITATVAGRDLVGSNSKAAVGGIADFAGTDLGINGAAANGLNLVFATEYPAGTPITTSQTIDVSAGVATLVSMIQQPTTLVTRQSFSPDVTVELRDQFGNKVESDSSSSVSVVLYDITGQPAVATTGQPALTAISTVASQGVATFSGLSYAVAPGTGYYLRVSLGGFTISSGVFDVLPGAATSIEIDVQPSTVIGAGLTPTGELIQVMPEISLYDQDGYLATTTNGTVTISATNSGDLSEGATSATVTNGQAEFTGIKLVGTPGQNYSLVFAFGSANKTSTAMQVTHNVATKIVVDRAAANGRSHEPFVTQPIVKILDRYDNLVTSGSDSSLDLRVVSSGGSVAGANITASGGIGTFTGLSLGGAVNTDYTFTYEATFRQDIATASQSGVQVGYGFASQLRIHQEPVSLSGGVLTQTGDALATQPVIHVTDNWGNIVENSTIEITASLFATQDARDRIVSATATAVNGVATFSGLAMVVRPETDYKIKFAAGSLNKTSGNIQVRHGDATALRIITEPSSVDGAALTMTGEVLATTPVVEAIDFDGNRATSVTGDIATATVSVGGGEAVVDLHSGGLQHNQAAFTAGVAAFQNLKVVALPGVEQKLAFDASIASTAVATPAASAGFVLTNNVAHQLAVLTQPCAGSVVSASCSTGVTGDTMLVQPVIEIQDRYGNRVPEFAGEVEIATSTAGSSILVSGVSNPAAQKATAVSGVATFSGIGLIALPSAQTQFSFTSPNLLSTTSANVVVAAAAPHKLVMATQPAGGRTGDALATQPVVHVLDRFDNHVLSDNSTVVTASIGSGVGGTLSSAAGSVTAVNGVVTFSDLVFSGVPGDNYTLSFDSGSLTSATSNTFSVTNGLAAGLNITSEPVGGKTGDLLSQLVELELLDDELNLAADDNSTVVTVAFAVTDGNARFVNSSDVTVNPTVTADGGVVDFGDLRVVGTPGYEYKLIFTATPTSGPSYNSPQSAGFTLTHANPAALVVTQSPVGGIVGGVLATQPTLRINDRFGNHATSDNSTTVSVSIFSGTGGSIVSGGSATTVGGVVNFGAIAASGTPGELYQLRFSATAANSATFSVDDTVGFRLSKTASLTFSYDAVDYAPDAIVSPTFATDSPAAPIFTTTSNSSVCELVLDPNTSAPNGQIKVKGVGSCVVSVTIPNAPFYSTISATETLVINKAQQAALVITSANNVDYWSTMTPTATGGSGTGALSFLVQGDCRIIGTTLIPGNAGSPCEITARKLGDANYQIAYSDPMDLTINKISQTPLRMANANTAAMIDLVLFTSGGSGTGEVTFAITTNRSVAGVEQCVLVENGTKLRALSSGTCGVSATKATSTNHLVAISPEQTITFIKAEQRVNFTSSIPAMPLVGSIYTPVAVASSGLPVTYTITSGSGTICDWDTDPTKIKFLAAGACEITATQVGDGQFSQANNVQTIVVNARNQTIHFAELANRTYGQPGFFLQATATSGLPVSFSVGAGSGSPACAISSGNFVNLLSAGSCEIIATQAGNQEFLAATPVKHIFTIAADLAGAPHLISISAGNQSVTASFNPPSYNGGSPITAYRLVATAANGDTYVNPGCPIGSGPVSCSLVGVPNAQPGVLNSGVYSLKVAAITIAGIGNYSMDSRAITASAGDMGVTNLIANPSLSTLTLNWDAPAALDSTFQEYEIYVWPLGGDEPENPTTTATGTTATFSTAAVAASGVRRSLFSTFSAPVSLAPADAYEFKVVTITTETQQQDENLNTTFGMQQSFSRPGQPTQLQLQELPEKLSLGWSIPAFDGGKPILSYTVKVNGETECEATSARICDFEEPRAGMTYEFEVFATNSIGDGAVATYSISIPAPPSTGGYVGPVVTHVMPNPAKPGDLVVVAGSMLDTVQSIAIAGRELGFSIASSNALSLQLPANIAEGLYDIVITSSYGRLTVQDALLISLITTVIDSGDSGDSGEDSGSSGTGNGSSSSEGSGESGAGDSGSGTDSGTDSGSGAGSDSDSGSQSNGGSGSGSDNAGESEVPVAQEGEDPERQGGASDLIWLLYLLAGVALVLAARRILQRK